MIKDRIQIFNGVLSTVHDYGHIVREWFVQGRNVTAPSIWSDDGTSRNDVSPYECSGPKINRPLKHNVPGLIHPCHYALCNTFWLLQNGRDVSLKGHCASGTIHLGDQGVPAYSYGDTSFRDLPSPHRLSYCYMRLNKFIRSDPLFKVIKA